MNHSIRSLQRPLLASVLATLLASAASAANVTLPLDQYRSLRVTNAGLTDRYLRHAYSQGVTSALSGSSAYADRIDASFQIRKGLADANCYSLESNNYPGSFLRHSYGRVLLNSREADSNRSLFDKDATWCARSGLSGQGVSFESLNFPGRYMRHRNSEVWSDGSDVNSPTFNADASWEVTTALTDQGGVMSGNPIFPGWYADPEARVFGNEYWVYPTTSVGYFQQTYLDAYSSTDLVHWTKHAKVFDRVNASWAGYAVWAPSVVEKNGKYYLFFGANDIQNDSAVGGIGVAVSDSPAGPFKDLIGRPLIDKFHNGAQPIDQMVFRDTDGQYYMYYGGWGHCNIVKLNDSFTGLVPFPDGSTYKEITPANYTEGSFMIKRNGKYYFMWSEGAWTGPDYSVAYAIANSPTGPFTRIGKILQQDMSIARGAGHHSVIQLPGEDKWYIVYHRRPLSETDGNSRETSIEVLNFDANGYIVPVKLTRDGVAAQTITYPGLTAQYFNGKNFETSVGSRISQSIDYDWGLGAPLTGVNVDNFSIRWTGKVVPRYSERYTFFIDSDNGRRVWVNNQLVIDRWTNDWGTEYNGSIQLQAGQAYDIRVEYFENVGGAHAKLQWSSPSQPRETIERFHP